MIDYLKKNQAIVVFESQKIRRDWHQDEWWFFVVDVVAVLTEQKDSLKARKYWNKLAQRLRNEGSEVVTNCHQMKLKSPDGKMRKTDCANTEGIFRIIQSPRSASRKNLRLLPKISWLLGAAARLPATPEKILKKNWEEA